LIARAVVAPSQSQDKKAALMRNSLKKQLSMLSLAVGFVALDASIATTSVAKQSHVRHRSASADPVASSGIRGTWSNPDYGYALAPLRFPRHYYPNPFQGDCTLDDGPFPCASDP
jgi:hypothetical protein